MALIFIPADTDTSGLTREEALDLEVSEGEAEEQYNEMLNDVYGVVNIAGLEYETARALRDVDPVAYRCGYADYVSEYLHEVDPSDFPETREDDDE